MKPDADEAKRRLAHWINRAIPLSNKPSLDGHLMISLQTHHQMDIELAGTGYIVDPVLRDNTLHLIEVE